LRGSMKYCEMLARSESSHDDMPLNTTSLSTSSLLRAEANFPLQSLASLPTIAEATSRPFRPPCAGMILTKPTRVRPPAAVVDQRGRRFRLAGTCGLLRKLNI
jgi:hypothetical protein